MFNKCQQVILIYLFLINFLIYERGYMPTIKSLLEYSQKVTKRKINMADIAKALNTSRSNITHKAKRETELKLSELKTIADYLQVENPAQFLNGALAMDEKLADTHATMPATVEEDEENIDMAYYEDVYGSCGLGSFVFSEAKQIIQVPKKIVLDYSGFKTYSVINASGDSMQPQIQDKDRLIVEHWNGEQITDNRVYIFRFKDQIFIKRLVLNLDQIVVKSDNKEYQTRYIEAPQADDFQIIGKIVGLMRTEV